jgi:4-amino-4-deoxy-L-arabinose transferase-like glycosyltransferase
MSNSAIKCNPLHGIKNITLASCGLILVFTLARLLIIGNVGLTDDEAYYWDWSRHLSLSYFDHPPLIAYLIAVFVWIGKNSEFFVRLGGVVLFFGSNVLLFEISRRLFDEKVGIFSVLLFNLIPVFALGAIIISPDNPFGFFFLFSAYLFLMAVESNAKAHWYLWGLLLGLALLCKYNGFLLAFSFLFYLVLSGKHRRLLRNPHLYLGLAICLLVFSPVLLWNLQHDWVSFHFQLSSGHKGHFSLNNLLLFVLSQAGYLSPLVYPFLILALFLVGLRGIKRKEENCLFLFCLSFPTLATFYLASPFLSFKPHWTALGYLPALTGLVQITRERWNRWGVKILSISGVILALVLTAFVQTEAFHPILQKWGVPAKLDITNELYGWKQVGEKVEKTRREMVKETGGDSVFFFSYRYQLVSQLAFYIPGRPEVYCLNDWLDAYDFFQRTDGLLRKDAVFVCDNRFDRRPEEFCLFDSIQQDEDLVIFRAGQEARRFYIFRCYDFQGLKNGRTGK